MTVRLVPRWCRHTRDRRKRMKGRSYVDGFRNRGLRTKARYWIAPFREPEGKKYHQELGRKMCAAFVAQHQGVTLNTAVKMSDRVGDPWLIVAVFAARTVSKAILAQFASLDLPTTSERVM